MVALVVFILTLLDIVYSAKAIDCSHIKQFVDIHNEKRLLLAQGLLQEQPPAEKMYYMMWDKELADKASEWASLNNYSHNPNRHLDITNVGHKAIVGFKIFQARDWSPGFKYQLDSGRFIVGENIYQFSSTVEVQIDVKMAVDTWFNENTVYKYKPIEVTNSGQVVKTGHYTQIIWADSIYLGCATSMYQDENNWHNFYVVCNYGPAGNVIGEYPYINGTNGSGELVCGTKDCSRLYGPQCLLTA